MFASRISSSYLSFAGRSGIRSAACCSASESNQGSCCGGGAQYNGGSVRGGAHPQIDLHLLVGLDTLLLLLLLPHLVQQFIARLGSGQLGATYCVLSLHGVDGW